MANFNNNKKSFFYWSKHSFLHTCLPLVALVLPIKTSEDRAVSFFMSALLKTPVLSPVSGLICKLNVFISPLHFSKKHSTSVLSFSLLAGKVNCIFHADHLGTILTAQMHILYFTVESKRRPMSLGSGFKKLPFS